jgi:SAM-dependent methyltransferase
MTAAGPGALAPDGSSVEVYRLLPHLGEADIVHAAAPAGATILELGSGVGRVTRELLARGHPVVAVDESAEMLAHVPAGAERVRSAIADLHLDRTFPVVLLGSHLLNTADDGVRSGFLGAAHRHLDADGVLIVEAHAAEWFDSVRTGDGGRTGDVDVRLADVHRDGDLLAATVHYAAGHHSWTHPFVARRFSDDQLDGELARHGLRRDRWLTANHVWFAARVRGPEPLGAQEGELVDQPRGGSA